MKIIVDANIVFSALLNTNGKIGDLLINSGKQFNFIAPEFLRKELFAHYPKLSKISKLTSEKIREAEVQICKDITFISEEQISETAWRIAEKLVFDIDPKDIVYIAFAKHFRCKLWSGDKALMKGLLKKGYENVLTTESLFLLREEKTKSKKK